MKKAVLFLVCAILLMFSASLAQSAQKGYVNESTSLLTGSGAQQKLSQGDVVYISAETTDSDGVSWYSVTTKDGMFGRVRADSVDPVISPVTLPEPEKPAVLSEKIRNESAYPVLTASGLYEANSLILELDDELYGLISVGDTTDASLRAKERLYELGFLQSKVTSGKWTKSCPEAIKKFQQKNGLEETGECDPRTQAYLYSPGALNSKGKTIGVTEPLKFSAASIKEKNGTYISLTITNTSGAVIDAFDLAFAFYNAFGERYLLGDLVSELELMNGITEETLTLKKGEACKLQGVLIDEIFMAGCAVAVTRYHTQDGETVVIPDDARHWYGFGKGVYSGYAEPIVSPLTEGEKARGNAYMMGYTGEYLPAELAGSYGLREGILVIALEEGSMMARAGIEAGDVILAVGDVRIFGGSSMTRAKSLIPEGYEADVLYLRGGSVYRTVVVRERTAK